MSTIPREITEAGRPEPNGDSPILAPEPEPTLDPVETYLAERYEFRHNDVLDEIDCRRIGGKYFIKVTDRRENSLVREIRQHNIKCTTSSLGLSLRSDFVPSFNPFKEYFDSLPEWDNETDYIAALLATVKVQNHDRWDAWFRKWLVALVASVLNDDVVNHTAVILVGSQGIGKTTWIDNLVPKKLRRYLFSGTINPGNKDTLIFLAECMLINLDELENMTKGDRDSLKELITKKSILVRRPYARRAEYLPHRASFVGSVNVEQFLTDTTGSRRFLVFNILDIDYEAKIDLDLVYAQAYFLYKSGFPYHFTKREATAITEHNAAFHLQSPEEEVLMTYFEPATDSGKDTKYMSASEIISYLRKVEASSLTLSSAVMMGRVLTKHRFRRIKKAGKYVYAVKFKPIGYKI